MKKKAQYKKLNASESFDKRALLENRYVLREAVEKLRAAASQTTGSSINPSGGSGAATVQTPGSSINPSGRSVAGTVQTLGIPVDQSGGSAAGTVQTPGSSIEAFGRSGSGTVQTPGSSIDPFGGSGAGRIKNVWSSRDPIWGIGAGTIQKPWSSIDPFGRSGAGTIKTAWSSAAPIGRSEASTSRTPSTSIGPIGRSGAATPQPGLSTIGANGKSGAASSSSLEGLHPISLTELEIQRVQRGRVLCGTLCADAFKINAILTVLVQDNGLAAGLEIHNTPHSPTEVKRLYPKGAKVSILDPFLKRTRESSLIILVENPANILMLNDAKLTQELNNNNNGYSEL